MSLQEVVHHLQRLRHFIVGDLPPVLDLHTKEESKNDGDAEIGHERGERADNANHILEEYTQPISEQIGGVLEVAVQLISQIGRQIGDFLLKPCRRLHKMLLSHICIVMEIIGEMNDLGRDQKAGAEQ
ncbi:hypothetical protein D3C71_1429330 [compost metagenome]